MTLHKPRPFLQDTAALASGVTILKTLGGKVLTKRYYIDPLGQVAQSAYDRATRFNVQTPVGGENIRDLHDALLRLEPAAQCCIIRGAPIAGTNLADTDRRMTKNGGKFEDVPRHCPT